MNSQARDSRTRRDRTLQRAIVLQLLRSDHPPRWQLAELAGELGREQEETQAGLDALDEAGVVRQGEGHAWASDAAKRLDELGLIAI